MLWIAPSEKYTDNAALEKRLCEAADQLRANSGLKAQEHSDPILGIILMRFAEVRFAAQRAKLEKASASARLPTEVRFDYLLNRPDLDILSGEATYAR
jgi:type I restriction enzyme M protein